MERADLRRRSLLGAVGAAVGLAGCGRSGTDPATDPPNSDTQMTPTSSATPTQPRPSEEQVIASRDGLVVPVARELDPGVTIDPDQTETPVGDAVRAIDEAGDLTGFGAVLLPPGTITEAEPLRPTQFTRFVGWGINTSVVEFVDLTADGVQVADLKEGKFVRFDNLTLSGSDRGRRTGGSAIHFVNDGTSPRGFDLGCVGFRDWIDPVLHFERGSPFGSTWEHLDFGFDRNDGREIVLEKNQSLLGTQVGLVSAGNATGDAVLSTRFSGARIHVGFLNIGGSAGRAIDVRSTGHGHLSVGGVNFETGVDRSGAIVRLHGPASTRLEYVRNADATVDAVVDLGSENANNVLGPVRVGPSATVREAKVRVTADPVGPSFYFGTSSDVVSTVGSFDGDVWALGDMTSVGGGTSSAMGGSDGLSTYAATADVAPGDAGIVTDDDRGPMLAFRDADGVLHRWDSTSTE